MNETSTVVVLNHRDRDTAAAILRVQQEAYEVEARITGFDEIPPLLDSVEEIMALNLTVLGILQEDEPVAILGYSRRDDVVDIDRLAVRPACFRRGLARMLLSTLHEREAGATRFTVSTGRDNEPAVNLYRRMGYRLESSVALPEGIIISRFVRELDGRSDRPLS